MKKARAFMRLWLPAVIYAALIFWISSMERPFGVELKIRHIDKLLHLIEYTVFGFLLMRAVRGSDPGVSGKKAFAIVFLIGAFYGFTDELHQSVVPGRDATIADFIFDALGSLIGAIGGHVALKGDTSRSKSMVLTK